jgi:hypothetical protein
MRRKPEKEMKDMKKIMFAVLAMVLAASLMASQEDTVRELLPDCGLTPAVFNLTAADIAAVQAGLGSQAPVRSSYEIYSSPTGAVVIEEQMGKWGIIKSAVLIDRVTKRFKNLGIISMSEKRGAPVKTPMFINQFTGKGAGDVFDIGNGIMAISGATISSKAMVITVKRALIVYGLYSAVTANKPAGKRA